MIAISGQRDLSSDEQRDGVTDDNPRIGYHNVITASNLTASSSDADWPIANLTNFLTYLFWQGTNLGEHTIRVQAPGSINYLAIAGHNLSGAVVQPQVSVDSTTWTALEQQVAVPDNLPFIYEFQDVTPNFFRIRLDSLEEVPVIAVLYVGRILRLQRRLYVGHQPMNLNRDTEVSTGRSESGQFLGRVKRRQSLQGSVNLTNLTAAWYRTQFDPFVEASELAPFFWAWRPDSYPDETALAWLTADPRVQNARSNGMVDVSMSLAGIGALAQASADVS